VVLLDAGDSCHFDGRVPHSIENAGESTARLFIALTPSAFEPLMRPRGEGGNGHTIDTAVLDTIG
jgi:hypothetical protein